MEYNQFVKQALFENVMSHGLDSYDNYSGPDWKGWLCGPSMSRDSEILEQSNFDVALDMLGGESDMVQVEFCLHWACGWFKRILIKANSKQAKKLYEIHQLLEQYPVLDDSDYFERENEYQCEYAEQSKDDLAKGLVFHLGLPEKCADDPELIELAYNLQLECQRYFGNDSCITILDCREIDDYEIKHLISCVEQLQYSDYLATNEYYKYLVTILDLEIK